MKKYILLIIMLCSGLSLFGQTRVHVYLHNGTQYRNVYLQEHETDYIILNLSAPDEEEVLVRINIENVRSIRYLKSGKKSAAPKIDPATQGFEKGMYYAIEMGGIVGKSHPNDDNNTSLLLKGIVGYTPVNYFGAGLGVGLDSYDDFSMMPIFVDIRGNIIEANAMPFYFVQTGYSAGWLSDNGDQPWVEEDINAQWMFTSGLGVRFDLGKSDIILSMGYKYQKAKITQEFEWEETVVEKRDINRITFGFGIIF